MPKHCINIDGVVDNKTLVQVRSTLNTVIEHAKALREEQAQATGITWTLQGPGPAAGAAGGLVKTTSRAGRCECCEGKLTTFYTEALEL